LGSCFPTLRFAKNGAPVFVLLITERQILRCAQDDNFFYCCAKDGSWAFSAELGSCFPTLRFAKNGAPVFVLLITARQILRYAQDDNFFYCCCAKDGSWAFSAGLGSCFPTLRFAKNGAPVFVLLLGEKQILRFTQDDSVRIGTVTSKDWPRNVTSKADPSPRSTQGQDDSFLKNQGRGGLRQLGGGVSAGAALLIEGGGEHEQAHAGYIKGFGRHQVSGALVQLGQAHVRVAA
jgi:hypothetical protein